MFCELYRATTSVRRLADKIAAYETYRTHRPQRLFLAFTAGTRLPNVAALATAAEKHLSDCQALLENALRAAPGKRIAADDLHLVRTPSRHSSRVFAADAVSGVRVDLTAAEERAFWAFASIEVLRHTGMRIEEMLELTHYSFLAYKLPATGEIVPMLQVAPSKTDQERLLLVSPELGDVLTAIIYRVRNGEAALPVVSAYDGVERVWSAPMPFLFQRRHGPEHRALGPSYIRQCINHVVAASGLTDSSGLPLRFTPHDFRRIFVTDIIRSGLPPHIAAKICGHASLDTTMGYAAIYPDDVVARHRAFIARRRTQRPGEEYRDLTTSEWDEFLAHFELRKVALGACGREYGTPCAHENACVRCPLLRVDPAQMPRLEAIHANLIDRLQEAKEQGWLGEVTAIETTLAAAAQKLEAMRKLTARTTTVNLGMPSIRTSAGRCTPAS